MLRGSDGATGPASGDYPAGVGSVVRDVVQIRTDLTPAGAYAAVTAFLRAADRVPGAVVA